METLCILCGHFDSEEGACQCPQPVKQPMTVEEITELFMAWPDADEEHVCDC